MWREGRLRAALLIGTSLGTALALLPIRPAWANPTGGTIVAGSAHIAGAGRLLTITQSSNRAIINWKGFSIGAGEATQFRLPSASAAILNRVTGGNPSVLLGKLRSNGQVYLINPSGVVVGPNGRIHTASFVASTLDLPDAAFMAGGSLTFSGGSTARIVNLGTIETSAGDVALIALDVVNKGSIAAANGQAILAAGGEVLYAPDSGADVLIKPAAAPGGVTNQGTIAAARVQLRAAGSVYALAVNNGGAVSATSVRDVGGQVVLDGGAGDVVSTGGIVASGPGGVGGGVTITGGRVAVSGVVNASGARGGGTIALAAAHALTVTRSALLRADATQSGNGGRISAKSAAATQFDGTASARGGPVGGHGGAAEISGGTLGFTGQVDLSAPQGKTGSLLFDPDSIVIDASSTALPPGVVSSGFWNYSDNPGAQTVGASAIVAALATTDLTLQANQTIAVNAAISSATANSLSLDAPGIAVNATISLPNGTLNFDGSMTSIQPPNDTAVTIPGISLTSAGGATLAAGTLFIGSFANTTLSGPVKTGFLDINTAGLAATSFSAVNAANATPLVLLGDSSGGANVYSGGFALNTTGATEVEGVATATGPIAITATGNLTLSAADVSTTQLASSGGQITLASTGGAFINDVGTSLFSGTGRRVIYSATDGSGYSDGGLGYAVVNPVSYGSDPDSSASHVIYIASSSLLPELIIAANGASRQYGLTDPGFSATYSGGTSADLLTLPQFEIVGGTAGNVGNYTIEPYGAVAAGYRIVYETGTLNVTRAPLTITPDLTRTYGASLPALLPDGDFAGFRNGDTPASLSTQPSLSTGATAASGVGSYAINASGAAAANYAITYEPGTLLITPAALTITPDLSRLYGGSLPSVLPIADFSGLLNGDTPASLSTQPNLNTGATATSGVGSYAITASGGAAGNYTISYQPGALSVAPAPLTIGIASASQTYGGTPSITFSYHGFVNGQGAANLTDPAVPFTTATADSGVGNYLVTGTGAYSPNYQITYTDGTLAVTAAPLVITPNLAFTYGGTLPTLLPAADFAGFVNGDTAASLTTQPVLHTSANSRSGAGTLPITASGAALANYLISYQSGIVTIDRAPLIITPDISTVYGRGLPSSLPASDFAGFVDGDTEAALLTQPRLSSAANASSPVGSYAVSASGAAAANYAISYRGGTVAVAPAALSIGATGTQSYGGTPSVQYSYSGFVNGDTAASLSAQPRFGTNADATSYPGNYSVIAYGAADPNYTISYTPGLMSVTTTPLVVTANDLTRLYGQAVAGSVSYAGFVDGDTPYTAFTLRPQTGDDPVTRSVGTYAETVQPGVLVNPGYAVSYRDGTVTVAPAPLAISANPAAMAFGATVPRLTGNFSGFVLGDQAWNTGYGFAANFPAGGPAPGATYPIALVGSDPNYQVTYTPATLMVGGQTLTALPVTIISTSPSQGLTNGADNNATIDPNDNNPGNKPSVTVYQPTLTLTVDWAGFGADAIPEETAIVQDYVDAMAGTSPPVTLGGVEGLMALDSPQALTMKATMMPFVYAELQSLLDEPQSQWTSSQAAFVTAMANFISSQRQQAAIQAENAYAAWQHQQQATEEADLAGLSGPAYAEESQILSSNPPSPPASFLQIAQGGIALTQSQGVSALGIELANAEITNSAQQVEAQHVQAEIAWLKDNSSGSAQNAALQQAESGLGSSDPTTVVNAELAIEAAYQSASGPSSVPGFTGGAAADVGHALWEITFAAIASPTVSTVKAFLGAKLAKVIFPHSYYNKASLAMKESGKNTDINKVTQNIDKAMQDAEKSGAADTKAGLNAGKTADSVASDVAKEGEVISDTLEEAGDVLGPLGLALELAGNVTQIVTGAVEYGQIADYNKAFSSAVNAANAPVTVADLKSMMNSSSGQSQLQGYIAGAMAVGDTSPPANVATESMASLMNYGF